MNTSQTSRRLSTLTRDWRSHPALQPLLGYGHAGSPDTTPVETAVTNDGALMAMMGDETFFKENGLWLNVKKMEDIDRWYHSCWWPRAQRITSRWSSATQSSAPQTCMEAKAGQHLPSTSRYHMLWMPQWVLHLTRYDHIMMSGRSWACRWLMRNGTRLRLIYD